LKRKNRERNSVTDAAHVLQDWDVRSINCHPWVVAVLLDKLDATLEYLPQLAWLQLTPWQK